MHQLNSNLEGLAMFSNTPHIVRHVKSLAFIGDVLSRFEKLKYMPESRVRDRQRHGQEQMLDLRPSSAAYTPARRSVHRRKLQVIVRRCLWHFAGALSDQLLYVR